MPQPIVGDEKVFKIIGWKVDSIIETGDVLTDEDLEATLIPAQLGNSGKSCYVARLMTGR